MKQPQKLSNPAIRHLRGLGHDLSPVVSIGKNGINEGLVDEAKRALLAHELVKVRVHTEAPVERVEAAKLLADATSSVLAQVLGRTFLLYKRHPEKAKIVLPRPGKAPLTGVLPAGWSNKAEGAKAKPTAAASEAVSAEETEDALENALDEENEGLEDESADLSDEN